MFAIHVRNIIFFFYSFKKPDVKKNKKSSLFKQSDTVGSVYFSSIEDSMPLCQAACKVYFFIFLSVILKKVIIFYFDIFLPAL